MRTLYTLLFILFSSSLIESGVNAQSQMEGHEIIGYWNLTFHVDGAERPGWLHAKRSGSRTIVGEFVGSSGNSRPISVINYSPSDNIYSFTIPPQWEPTDSDLSFSFSLTDSVLDGQVSMGDQSYTFSGKPAPKLIRETPPVWGTPVNLLDDHMSRWVIPNQNQFVMKDGHLVNEGVGGNLVTKETYDDFKLHAEFRYPEGSNSGLYLRGRYEVQIADNLGQDINKQIIGGIYGFIEPSLNAAKGPGEWQTFDITLVGRMVTVVHNGVEVISNRSIPGITGGALDSHEGEPGPLMIQGDHGPIEFRKITLTPAH